MTARPLIPLGGNVKIIDTQSGRVEERPSGMMLLPAREGTCAECATDHAPDQPHNCGSLFYQMQFHAKSGRWPVWADAVAHCAPAVRAAWETELRARGHWKEPTPPVPVKHETRVPAGALLQPGEILNVQDEMGGPDRPGKVLAVVPVGVPVEHAIADQNGQPRPAVYTLNRRRSTQYVIEVANADGTTSRAVITEPEFAKGLAKAKPRADE